MLDYLALRILIASQGLYYLVGWKGEIAGRARSLGAWLVIAFLGAQALLAERPSHYTLLGVPLTAANYDVQQGYKAMVLRYHPDKNISDPDAPQRFKRIKDAYAVLINEQSRAKYNRFGDYAPNGDPDEKMAVTAVCLAIVVHLFQFLIAYALTFQSKLRFARQIFVVYNIAAFCLEVQMRYVDDLFFAFVPGLKSIPAFQKVAFFRDLLPFVVGVSSMISIKSHQDADAVNLFLLRAVLSTSRALGERLKECTQGLEHVYAKSGPSTAHLQTDSEIPVPQSRGTAGDDIDPAAQLAKSFSPEQLELIQQLGTTGAVRQPTGWLSHLTQNSFVQFGIWGVILAAWLYWH